MPELTIGELSERSGVPASTLRYYERHGLLRSRRTTGNQRRYDEAMLRQVAFIRASQRVGIPLADIGGVLEFLPEGGTPTPEFWARAAQCWGRAIDERIAALERRREVFSACAECGCLAFGECALVA
ncbi:redox-sensitive transcriptional activator SoxR [Jiangella alba]|uniref:MerR family transcriptional regulator, redox-sensitive transcriptional activator SoxR n=1 Tax=Jiangella alba TaxID=561176 RepID=A0A1H5PTY8_9ACTN|nr:redox-sensitive transcriptional activator SoxR [Jiangella alba]SEF17104.1 MerR family transcriptional regulator, redox-sensitive transcriptional activator SoxR [Jiangella alba]